MSIRNVLLMLMVSVIASCSLTDLDEPKNINVLIVDGQNNHIVWPKTTMQIKSLLEQTGKFNVDIERTQFIWKSKKFGQQYRLQDGKNYIETDPKTDPEFAPDFSQYDVVISNFGWRAAEWPESTKEAFENYMESGGGLVVIHAADNSFPKWTEFNKMIGLGGWGGRNEKDGPYVYYSDDGKLIRDLSPGNGGGHGKQHEFDIQLRQSHEITAGFPALSPHFKDELYNRLRGPAENMTVLATAFDDPKYGGSGRHEPVLMTIDYHQGRVFHSTLGHSAYAMQSDFFKSSLLRGTQWAAGAKVSFDGLMAPPAGVK